MPWYLPDWLTGYDAENARRAAEADARLRALNAQRYGGTPLEQQVRRNYEAQGEITVTDQRAAITDAFRQELNARADAIVGTPVRTLGETLVQIVGAAVRAIPPALWLLAAAAAFIYLRPWRR